MIISTTESSRGIVVVEEDMPRVFFSASLASSVGGATLALVPFSFDFGAGRVCKLSGTSGLLCGHRDVKSRRHNDMGITNFEVTQGKIDPGVDLAVACYAYLMWLRRTITGLNPVHSGEEEHASRSSFEKQSDDR